VLSGGFPCQPHSASGRRKASADERDLWPEYRRLIRELRPGWVVAENVRGLLSSEDGRFFAGILRDSANLGFDVGWCVYRAADVGAFHFRERAFVISYANGQRCACMGADKEGRPSDYYTQAFRKGRAGASGLPLVMDGYVTDTSSGCERNDDGFPEGLDRLKRIGNAVVPQQAYPIFKAIAEIEEGGGNDER